MTDVGRCNDGVCCAQGSSLGRKNDIAIQGRVCGSGFALLASLRPELGSLAHCLGCDRKVFSLCDQGIQAQNALGLVGSQEFSAHFIIGNLWHNHPIPGRQQGL